MNKRILSEFKRLRKAGYLAAMALSSARTIDAFRTAEFNGLVRLRTPEDDTANMDDLKGDTFNRKVNPEIPESRMAREEKEFEERVNRLGVVGIVGEFRIDSEEGEEGGWENADSVWGFVGDDWKDSGYDVDVMATTLKALEGALADVCPHCCGTGKRSGGVK